MYVRYIYITVTTIKKKYIVYVHACTWCTCMYMVYMHYYNLLFFSSMI